MATPPSSLPPSAPPTSTTDQNFILQNSTAPTGNLPQLQARQLPSPIETDIDSESTLDSSDPIVLTRYFPDAEDSDDEVRIIEHHSTSSTASISTLQKEPHDDSSLIWQQVKTALTNKDRYALPRLFSAHPALVNAQIPDLSCPPLVAAVRVGDREIVEALLDIPGIHVDARDSEHRTAIHAACESGNLELTRLLIAHGANLHTHNKYSSPLIAACRGGHPALIAYLVRKTPRQLIDFRPPGGNTALMNAIACGNIDAVGKLLAQGANPNHIGMSAKSPLHYAAEHAQVGIVKLLIRQGAVQRKSTFGYPLDVACRSGCIEIAELLLAIPATSEEWQGCALVTAIEADQLAILKCLLAHGVSPNAMLQNQTTPLMIASDLGNIDAAALLITRGADAAYVSPTRQSALSKAIEKRGSRELILLLLSAMPVKLVLDRNLALRLIRRAKRRQDYRILNELATRQFEDRFGNAYDLRRHLN